MYGSEVLYGKLVEGDLLEIIRDALFGKKTTTEGGCTFTAKDIICDMPFTRAHLLSEKRYMIPTFVGFALKYSAKVAVVVKGRMGATLTGVPQLITSKFEKIVAKITVKPTIAFHMHHKVGVWLPIFETGLMLQHQLFSEPKIDVTLTLNQQGFKLEAPIAAADQKLLVLKPKVHAVMRKELVVGNRQWFNIDLQLRNRGFIDVPQTCYGKDYLTLWLCVQGRIADPEYLRLKRITTFPYYWLNQLDLRLKNDDENTPTKFMASYTTTTNTDAVYEGQGTIQILGKTIVQTTATMTPHCDKTKWTCDTKWIFKHKKCPQTCTADMTIDYSQANRLEINTKYGGDKELNHEVLVEEEGKALRIVNTWNKLPVWVHEFVRLHRPRMITFLHRFFGIKGVIGAEKRCEIEVKLFNKFVADILVNAPTMQLRRINQALPFAINNFYVKNRVEMIKLFYGACLVQGTNHIETTDNVVIKEEIPGHCPFVLAEDAREEVAKWRILLRKVEGGRQQLIAEIGKDKIEIEQDKTVKVNGVKVEIKPGMNVVPGGKVAMINNQVYFQADAGFQCLFDGSMTIVLFSPWYHNRIQGICGNNDGEQWTDFGTRRKTFMPETMTKEFLREWVVEGTTCKDKQCKLKGKHMKLTTGAPEGKVCFTIGRFLRCVAQCTAGQKHQFEKVAYHCLAANDPLVARIQAGDPTVALETRSVDTWGPVEEHLTCQCNCQ
ncbi:vitellogenin B [Paramuricea clavata]|nr:vitellogenin B [Paramuricea clavata]